jgi:hypothetical protein
MGEEETPVAPTSGVWALSHPFSPSFSIKARLHCPLAPFLNPHRDVTTSSRAGVWYCICGLPLSSQPTSHPSLCAIDKRRKERTVPPNCPLAPHADHTLEVVGVHGRSHHQRAPAYYPHQHHLVDPINSRMTSLGATRGATRSPEQGVSRGHGSGARPQARCMTAV